MYYIHVRIYATSKSNGKKEFPAFPSGGLAQLARAPALQAGGQRFESVILHESGQEGDEASGALIPRPSPIPLHLKKIFDILEQAKL